MMITRLEREIQKTTIRFSLAAVILLIAAIALSVIWNRSIKTELAIQASSFVRKIIVSNAMRGVTEDLNGVRFTAFAHVSLYSQSGEHIITLPPVFDRKNIKTDLWMDFLYPSITVPIYLDTEAKNLVARAIFSYPRFELVPYAILIWFISAILLSFVFLQAKKKVKEEFKKEVRFKNAELTEAIAKKVRHNIRSPLASLNAIFVEKIFSPETLLSQGIGVIKRLEEIIEELKPENISALTLPTSLIKIEQKAIYNVTSMVKSIVSEKKLISKDVSIDLQIETNEAGIYTFIPSAHLKPTLSNIIDNSLQAIQGQGTIQVLLSADDASFSIEIIDSGVGIPKENLSKVFEKDFTFGKLGGSGVGLFYAKELIDSNLGNININSEVGAGTTLSIILPKADTPSWHVDSISLEKYTSIALCDDQQSMIDAWRIKLNSSVQSLPIHSFRSCEAMDTVEISGSCLYLVDYDLGVDKMKGLEFLKKHPSISSHFILVTGHYDEPWLQSECEGLNCRLLPKDNIFQIELT